jgi:cytochrome c-type biogenesis protein CcmF
MSSTLGFALLLLIFSIGIFLPFWSFFTFKKNNERDVKELEKISLFLSAAMLSCALFAQACLIYSFIISDYSVSNVYQNSHHLKPLIYKIAASWGNHEGSMLLLITIISAYSFAFALFSKTSKRNKIITLSSQSLIIGLFAAFTAFTSNPFLPIFPTPSDGLGLNPLLQDIGLALHPPVLYIGYLGFSLVFSCTIAGLISEKIDQDFAKNLKNWLFFSWGFLTLGIGLGSWWAYRELGWGGYWFWDPVENVALMPWLAATTLIHCLKLLEKKEIFKIWAALLGIVSFILCLLGIFLVRSGVLTSVHSFAVDAKRGFFVILLIAVIGGFGLLIFGAKMTKLKSEKSLIFLRSKIGAILFNNYLLIIALFTVLLGTIYPIFSRGFFDQFISIGPNYYNQIFSILILPFLAFLALSPNLDYEKNSHFLNRRIIIKAFISLALALLGFFFKKDVSILQIVILFLAIFAAAANIHGKNLRMILAHLGFSLAVIGIVLNSSFGLTKEVNLRESESFEIANYEIKFSQITYEIAENYLARGGKFEIYKNKQSLGELTPTLNYYPVSQQTTNEAAIRHGIFDDLYLVIGTKDENENYAVRAIFRPFIYLIWLGCFLIFSSAFIGKIYTFFLNLKSQQK